MRKYGCGIGSAASSPLPAQRVLSQVCIDQSVPKPVGAFLPGDEQVFD